MNDTLNLRIPEKKASRSLNDSAACSISGRDKLIDYLKAHGRSSLSFSSLQAGLDYHLSENKGYIAYTHAINGTPLCLADPVSAHEHKRELLVEFLQHHKQNSPIFMHVGKETADILSELGYYINELGTETIIDVQNFSTTGSKKEFLRSQRNRAQKDKVKVVELDSEMVNKELLRQISNNWLEGKAVSTNELSFLTRPVVFDDEANVRKFYAIKDMKIVGFVYFDPMYEQGKLYGYIANNLRSNANVSYSITDFIILEALKKFKEEGIQVLSLGLSPFHNITDSGNFKYSKPLQMLFRFTFEHCNHLYSFKKLSFHKKRYRPELAGAREDKVYVATKSALPFVSVYGIFLKMGFDPFLQTLNHLKQFLINLSGRFKRHQQCLPSRKGLDCPS
jgi:lysylphosphatidylglycerol synthetase-like protein (DUF2156 family)